MFLMNKLVIHYGVLFSAFTAYRTQCCQILLWLVKFSVQPTWHALKPYDKRNRRTDRCSECSTSTHRAHRYSKVGLCRRSTRYWPQKPSNDKQSRSMSKQSPPWVFRLLCQVTLAQRFLEVGTELFEAIKNYDAEALIGLQKDQIFTFLQVEAQHSKLLLHSENILWYARCTIIQYRRLEVRTWFHDMSRCCTQTFHMGIPSAGCSNSEAIKGFPAQIKRNEHLQMESCNRFPAGSFWVNFDSLEPGCCSGCAQSFRPEAPKGETPFGCSWLTVRHCQGRFVEHVQCMKHDETCNVICNFLDLPEIAVFLTSKLLLHCTFRHRYSWCHFWGGYAAEKPQPVDIADLIQ